MRITRLTLPSTDVDACLAFYRDVLQLRTTGMTVHVGWSDIDIVPSSVATGSVHLAFNIPHHRFEAACAWLRQRALLLRDPLGEERFRIGGAWDADSVYFAGPHDAVLEIIARRPLALEGASGGDFRSCEIACVSEVGLPTDDVPALVRKLVVSTGLVPFGDVSDVFAPMGDHEGLLIVVDSRRPWFPELRRLPFANCIQVTIEGVLPGAVVVDGQGWRLASRYARSPGNNRSTSVTSRWSSSEGMPETVIAPMTPSERRRSGNPPPSDACSAGDRP